MLTGTHFSQAEKYGWKRKAEREEMKEEEEEKKRKSVEFELRQIGEKKKRKVSEEVIPISFPGFIPNSVLSLQPPGYTYI